MENSNIIPFGKLIGKDIFGITAYSCYTKNPNLIRDERSYIFGNILLTSKLYIFSSSSLGAALSRSRPEHTQVNKQLIE